MGDVRDTYPTVFRNKGSNKPHSKEFRDFGAKWGSIKTLYEIADEKIEKVGEVYQLYLSDYMQFLTYLIEKGEVDEIEEKVQQALHKAKNKHK